MTDDGLTDAQDQLYQFMSDTSELAYCAGWMTGTEYRLWAFMSDTDDDGEWGMAILTPDVRMELLRLSEQMDGWICWADAAERGAGSGPKFIATADWQKDYARWAGRQAILRRHNPRRYIDYTEAHAAWQAAEAEIRAVVERDDED